MEAFLPDTSLVLNALRTKIISMKQNLIDNLISQFAAHIIGQPNKEKSRLPRESSLNRS